MPSSDENEKPRVADLSALLDLPILEEVLRQLRGAAEEDKARRI